MMKLAPALRFFMGWADSLKEEFQLCSVLSYALMPVPPWMAMSMARFRWKMRGVKAPKNQSLFLTR